MVGRLEKLRHGIAGVHVGESEQAYKIPEEAWGLSPHGASLQELLKGHSFSQITNYEQKTLRHAENMS